MRSLKKICEKRLHLGKAGTECLFAHKAEQDEFLQGWSDATVQKLKSVYMNMLEEAGILDDRKTGELRRLFIDEPLKNHLRSIGDGQYIELLGDTY